MPEEMLLNSTRAMDQFADSVQGRAPTARGSSFVVAMRHIIPPAEDVLFKYVSDTTWDYISAGSFQLGSCDFYRSIENANANDAREGECMVALRNGKDQVNLGIRAGFNCALYCGTAAFAVDPEMKKKFGGKLIRISPLSAFMEVLRSRLRARRAYVCDVVYTNDKTVALEHADATALRAYLSTMEGKLDIKVLNRKYFDLFYELGVTSTLFVKPAHYAHERERRVVIERSNDLTIPTLRLQALSLLQYISVVE
jgi:hypothetical protein